LQAERGHTVQLFITSRKKSEEGKEGKRARGQEDDFTQQKQHFRAIEDLDI